MRDIKHLSDLRIDNIFMWDWPDLVDAYAEWGEWDDGSELTDDDLDEINENYPDVVQEWAREQIY